VKIAKDGNDIAEFAYDALGRRIEKKDLIDANETTLMKKKTVGSHLCFAQFHSFAADWLPAAIYRCAKYRTKS